MWHGLIGQHMDKNSEVSHKQGRRWHSRDPSWQTPGKSPCKAPRVPQTVPIQKLSLSFKAIQWIEWGIPCAIHIVGRMWNRCEVLSPHRSFALAGQDCFCLHRLSDVFCFHQKSIPGCFSLHHHSCSHHIHRVACNAGRKSSQEAEEMQNESKIQKTYVGNESTKQKGEST